MLHERVVVPLQRAEIADEAAGGVRRQGGEGLLRLREPLRVVEQLHAEHDRRRLDAYLSHLKLADALGILVIGDVRQQEDSRACLDVRAQQ